MSDTSPSRHGHPPNLVSMPRLQWLSPATPVINRRALLSKPANGHVSFIPQIRKLVFEYCDVWASSSNLRRYIYNHVEHLARQNPHVEFVIKQRASKEPIIRGFYLNSRDKVVGLKGLEVTQIQQKVQLVLDSSGAKIVPLKRRPIVSVTEATRGIWSGLHVPEPFRI